MLEKTGFAGAIHASLIQLPICLEQLANFPSLIYLFFVHNVRNVFLILPNQGFVYMKRLT